MCHGTLLVKGCKAAWEVAKQYGITLEVHKATGSSEDSQQFVGLAIDDDQQEALTAERLNRWCVQIVAEFGLDLEVSALDD